MPTPYDRFPNDQELLALLRELMAEPEYRKRIESIQYRTGYTHERIVAVALGRVLTALARRGA